ncbi:MAG: tetratricopeptide repeat protein [Bryobacteraceae bacterium]
MGPNLEEAKRAFDVGDYTLAARLFEESQVASPRCDTLFHLGLSRYRLSQTDAALIAFQSAVECDPQLVAAHLALAEAYGIRGMKPSHWLPGTRPDGGAGQRRSLAAREHRLRNN